MRMISSRAIRLLAVLILSVFLMLTLAGVASAKARPAEKKMRRLINAERVERGLGRLQMKKRLVKISRQHSRRLADEDALYHNDDLFAKHRKPRWHWVGENVGRGGTIVSLHRAFMDSPPHRDNILFGPADRIGVGVARSNGTVYITIAFVEIR